jgi:hypothetical protein
VDIYSLPSLHATREAKEIRREDNGSEKISRESGGKYLRPKKSVPEEESGGEIFERRIFPILFFYKSKI